MRLHVVAVPYVRHTGPASATTPAALVPSLRPPPTIPAPHPGAPGRPRARRRIYGRTPVAAACGLHRHEHSVSLPSSHKFRSEAGADRAPGTPGPRLKRARVDAGFETLAPRA